LLAALATLTPPAVAQAPLPAVLKPGMRLTWWAGSASIPGARSILVQNANGDWVDPSTGQKYAEANNPGAGYTQVDILSAGPEGIAADVHMWLITDVATRQGVSTATIGIVGNSQSLDFLW